MMGHFVPRAISITDFVHGRVLTSDFLKGRSVERCWPRVATPVNEKSIRARTYARVSEQHGQLNRLAIGLIAPGDAHG